MWCLCFGYKYSCIVCLFFWAFATSSGDGVTRVSLKRRSLDINSLNSARIKGVVNHLKADGVYLKNYLDAQYFGGRDPQIRATSVKHNSEALWR